MLNIIEKRRSCRSFDSKMVDEKTINEIIKAGLYAANGRDFQNGIVIAITNKNVRDRLSSLNASIGGFGDKDPFYGAPVILLVAVKKSPNAVYDGSTMIENMLLEATNQGLGSCWIHRAKQELESNEGKEILSSLNINLDDYEGIGHVALGYELSPNYSKKEIKEGRAFFIK